MDNRDVYYFNKLNESLNIKIEDSYVNSFLKIQDFRKIDKEEIEYSFKYNIFIFKKITSNLDKALELRNVNYGWKMFLHGKEKM